MGNTKVGIGYCNKNDAFLSGKFIVEKAMKVGSIQRPDFVFAFCAGHLNHYEFFKGLQSVIGNNIPIIGGSSIGIITNDELSYRDFPAGAALIQTDSIKYSVAAADGLDKNEKLAGQELARKLSSTLDDKMLLIFYDSVRTPATGTAPPVLNSSSPLLAGIEEDLQANMPIIGAGLIGDYTLSPTNQFCGTYVSSQNVVGIALSGNFNPYFRIMHGCTPLDGTYYKITKMEGSVIYELDGKSVVDIIDEYFGNRDWRVQNPVNYLTIGVNHGDKYGGYCEGNYVNRLIVGAVPNENGISLFEEDLECGMEIQFMLRDSEKMLESAKINSAEIIKQIEADGKMPVFGMYIDCAGRTAEYSNTLYEEASEVQRVFNRHKVPLLGFYSGVEIAPLLQKNRGLDWTGVLMVLAEDKQNG